MPIPARLLLLAAAAGLTGATLAALADLLAARGDRRVLVQSLAGSGFVLLAVFLALEAFSQRWFPTASPADVLAWVALGSVGAHLACLTAFRIRALAPFLLPAAAACALAAFLAGDRPWGSSQVPWTLYHGLAALLGQAAFALAFGAGALYLVQARRLKSDPTRAGRLPSLETLDRLNLWGLLVALPLWTLALVAGILKAPGVTPLLLLSAGAWLVLALVTAVRLSAAVRGPKVALLTVAGFLLSLAAILGAHP